MAKFYGEIGYVDTVETVPGVYTEVKTVRNYCGDIMKNHSFYQTGEGLNDDLNVSNVISIVADEFAYKNSHKIRYIEFMGAKWIVRRVEVQRPRLILSIGGVYNE